MTDFARTLGERIRLVRGAQSQADFATRMGVAKNTIGHYERGERQPDAEFLAKIRDAFGVSIDWLLTGEGEMRQGAASAPAPAGAAAAVDPDLVGRVLEAISAVYKEMGWGKTLQQLGAEAVRIAEDIAAEGLAEDERPAAVKAASAMLRRQLRQAVADPTGQTAGKLRG